MTTPSGPLAGAEARVAAFIADGRAKFDAIEHEVLPVVHDGAVALQQLLTSRIVAEVSQLAAPLDPEFEAAIATAIRVAGEAAEKVAGLTAPAPDTPAGLDAEPEPDVPPAAP